MSTNYARHVLTKQTPQSEPIPGTNQVPDSAGGFAFAIDDWKRLDRFLILGADGGTYYASERKLTKENAECVLRCLSLDAKRTIDRVVEISDSGRAPKNDPAIFALVLAAGLGSPGAREYAYAAMPKVCRIGTHLFQFAEAVQEFRGWGRGLRRAIGKWYTTKEPDQLAYQLLKYQSRNGWSHRDLLKLCHVRAPQPKTQVLFRYVTHGYDALRGSLQVKRKMKSGERVSDYANPTSPFEGELVPVPTLVAAFEEIKKAPDAKAAASLIREFNLPRECVPTQFLTDAGVWEALLEKMPMTAMIRNLGNMTKCGLVAPMSTGTGKVLAELANVDRVRKARVHPLAALVALKTYAQGHGERGKSSWTPVQQVVDALDGLFYTAFGNVESTGKRWLLGVDVSGSMECGTIAGMTGITPRIAAAAMSLVTAASEPQHLIFGFSHAGAGYGGMHGGGTPGFMPIPISPRMRLDTVMQKMREIPMGGTDCSLPMVYALQNRLAVDTFVVYTDNETWAGSIHPVQALRQYRDKTGIPAKLIVVGLTATAFSIADPNDAGMLDVVGFDTATPALMADFAVN